MGYDQTVFMYVDNIRIQEYQDAVEKAKVFRKYGVNVMTPARPTQSSRRLVAAIAKIERRRRLEYERLLQEKQNLWREQQKFTTSQLVNCQIDKKGKLTAHVGNSARVIIFQYICISQYSTIHLQMS